MFLKSVTPVNFAIFLLASSLLSPPTVTGKESGQLNDTGIHYGADYPKGINKDCIAKIGSSELSPLPTEGFLRQQDCAVGLSKGLSTSDSSFSYQKIDATGKPLPDTAEQWQCVQDQVSGLMWEVKHNDKTHSDLHYKSDKFTWYNSNPKRNGGNIGHWNQNGSQCQGYQPGKPRTYCHVEQFVSRVNKHGLCGFKDWRVPTPSELNSLIHFGEFQPSIDSGYFPNTSINYYWTQSPMVGRPIEAWAINFEFGNASPLRKTDLRPVRLVRGKQGSSETQLKNPMVQAGQVCQANTIAASSPTTRFEDHKNGTVTDTHTGLMWQRCLLGQSGIGCQAGDVESVNWAEALLAGIQNTEQATLQDYQDWRLPNVRELASIIESQCTNPAINSEIFPNNKTGHLWSSSPYRFYDHYAWFVDFNDGLYVYGDRQDKKFVRLVRNN